MIWVETIINGVLYGGLYGLLGVGLALIVGVMRVVNLSHGEFIVLSAFLGVSLVGVVPWLHPLALLLPVALIAFVLGFVLMAGPHCGRPPATLVICRPVGWPRPARASATCTSACCRCSSWHSRSRCSLASN